MIITFFNKLYMGIPNFSKYLEDSGMFIKQDRIQYKKINLIDSPNYIYYKIINKRDTITPKIKLQIIHETW